VLVEDLALGHARSHLVATGALIAVVGAASLVFGVTTRSAGACALGGTVTVVGIILSMLSAVDRLWESLAANVSLRRHPVAWLSTENLIRDTERGLVAVSAIALCGAVAVTAATLQSFRSSAIRWYGFRGDAMVASRTPGQGWLSAALLPAATEIAKLPAVAVVDTLRVLHGQTFRGERIAVVGLSDGYLADVTQIATPDTGATIDDLVRGDAVVVSENFSEGFSVFSGDHLVLDSPTGALRLVVRAVVPDFTSDRGSVIVGAALLKNRWQDDWVNYISVDLRADADVATLRRQIDERVRRDGGLVTYETGTLRQTIDEILAGRRFVMSTRFKCSCSSSLSPESSTS
jgi:hypothetical protein